MKLLKLTFIFFLLIIASAFPSPSFAAGRGAAKFMRHGSYKAVAGDAEITEQVHERLLRVNMGDYGRYDPAPTFVKPPFKLIPN